MLENTEGPIKNGESRETGNTKGIQDEETKQRHDTIMDSET